MHTSAVFHTMKLLLTTACIFVFAGPAFAGRYVSLAPSTTEILFALGVGEELVGVSTYCDYPPEAHSKPTVGDFSQPNMEKIASLKPDRVFCTGLEQSPTIDSLKKLGMPVCVSNPMNLTELYDSIREIGALVNRPEKARELVDSMRRGVEECRAKALRAGKRPKVFFEVWSNPLMTAGKGSFIDELIGIAGGINVCHETLRPYCRVSEETVIHNDPDVIVLLCMVDANPVERLRKRLGWENISAVRNKRVYNDIDRDTLARPGPRLVDGLRELQKRLYP